MEHKYRYSIASNKMWTKHVYLYQLCALVVLFLDTSLHEFSSMDNVCNQYNYFVKAALVHNWSYAPSILSSRSP